MSLRVLQSILLREARRRYLLPEVIYTWAVQDRSFLILSRIKGSILRDA